MNINEQARNNGVFLGIILVVFTIVLSYVNPRVFLTTRSFLLIVPFIIILVKNAFDIRKSKGGFIGFKKLFLYSFTTSAIAITLCTAFEYVLFNHLYPELVEIYREIGLEALEQSKSFFNDQTIEKSRAQFEKENLYGVTEVISLYLTRLLVPGALLSLLVAGILKKSKPIINT